MIYLTILARVSDGLPLAASVGDDEESDQNMVKYNNQAKMLFRKISPQSPKRCSLETDAYMFHYLIELGVCYLCLCDRNFPEKAAFGYLQALHSEFSSHYGRKVDAVTRPYHFIEFDAVIQSVKRRAMEGGARGGGLGGIGAELQDVQRIMIDNIDSVIHRGETLTILDDKAANLSVLSKKYKEDARYLNRRASAVKIAAIVILVVGFLLYWRFF